MPQAFAYRFTVALSVAMLGACATQPLPPLELNLPVAWQQAALADAGKVDLRGWWHAFHDPQLDALVDAALKDNLNVAAARERLLAARELEHSAPFAYLPMVRAKTEDAIDPDSSESFFVVGFDALWELPLFGRGVASQRQAQGNYDLNLADLQQARVSLVAEVVRDWLDLRAAQQRQATLEDIVSGRQKQLDLQQVRLRLKLSAPDAVAQAEAALAQARAALAEPRQTGTAAAQGLAALLGRSAPDPAWLAPGPLPDLGAMNLTSAPADLLRTRPEIAQAQAAVLSAAGDAGMARADQFPSVRIGGSIVWSTNITTHRNKTREDAIASLGPLLDIPLFDWGLRRAAAQAKGHELKAAVFAYRQAVLDGVAEVQSALGQLQQQQQQEQQSALAATALGRAQAGVAKRVELGLDSPLDQLDGEVLVAQADLARIDARAAHGLAFVSLYKALGGAPLPSAADLTQAPAEPQP